MSEEPTFYYCYKCQSSEAPCKCATARTPDAGPQDAVFSGQAYYRVKDSPAYKAGYKAASAETERWKVQAETNATSAKFLAEHCSRLKRQAEALRAWMLEKGHVDYCEDECTCGLSAALTEADKIAKE